MRMVMLLGKLLMLLFWLAVILNLAGLIPVPSPQRLNWLALAVLVVHLLEWRLLLGSLRKLGQPVRQFVLVMLFGVLHLRDPATRRALNQAL